ncbi:MAG: excinuclease ABC subunit A [Phycisphaerales bacterium]|nr:MAG: excinuclease ABC subunit A [Phycisphaerales bacterium]
MDPRTIQVIGAREHNLKDVSLSLPRDKLICFTGVSGSGKSTFAFDTIFAEGQRRYIESLSAYARQFLGQLPKPNVDKITGLSPAIAIQQKTSGWNPRSTVGTITQIHDFLRVLFARIGTQHCPDCTRPIQAQTRDQIVARIVQLPPDTGVLILAPMVRGQKGEFRDFFEDMLRQGYARARVDGVVVKLGEAPALARNVRHDIEIVVDRLTLTERVRPRLAEAVETALRLADGSVIVQTDHDGPPSGGRGAGWLAAPQRDSAAARRPRSRKAPTDAAPVSGDLLLSSRYACPSCGLSFDPPSPQLLSFNSPVGMCRACDGLGERFDFDDELLVPAPSKSFLDLAIEPMRTRIGKWRRHIYQAVADHVGFDLKTPWNGLSPAARSALLHGLGSTHLTFTWRWSGGVWRHGGTFDGVIAELRANYRKAKAPMVRAYYEKYMRRTACGECHGARLNRQAAAIRLNGDSIVDVGAMTIAEADAWVQRLELDATQHLIADQILREIRERLRFLLDVGLDYLSLDRAAPTLSGGESQRIRLASQIGCGLVGVLYVLDEPSIGLHARDNRRLLDSLLRLRDMGNTVIVVEHDEETMRSADVVVDFGPGPGVRGGEVVAVGPPQKVARSRRSVTGQYLRGASEIEVPERRRPVNRPRRA